MVSWFTALTAQLHGQTSCSSSPFVGAVCVTCSFRALVDCFPSLRQSLSFTRICPPAASNTTPVLAIKSHPKRPSPLVAMEAITNICRLTFPFNWHSTSCSP
uniref:Uncharacterized protein n=1 Tax=Panstrongylus lignarius TaxID=156445 RepID=A0A224XQP7_9HEMI